MHAPHSAIRDDPALPYHLRWVWDGTAPDDRHVLVRCYHGLGDTLQFARFLPALAARAASVTFEVQPRLACLFGDFPVRVVPFDPARPHPPAEVNIESMELARALGIAPAEAPPAWLHRPAFHLPPGTIGLCCRTGDWDPERAIPPHLLEPLSHCRTCFSLDLGRSPLAVLNPGGCPDDIEATAALIAGCELVVSADTMVAHLAGALGKPAILLLRDEPDWRWAGGSGRSEWYPDFRLIRQPAPGAWEPAVAQLLQEIKA